MSKKLGVQSFEEGPPHKCTKNCFEIINETERKTTKFMNEIRSNDEANLFLSDFVIILPGQHRQVEDEDTAKFRHVTYFL